MKTILSQIQLTLKLNYKQNKNDLSYFQQSNIIVMNTINQQST